MLQALALINDCNKYKMDLTTNGVVIADAIKFVQTNKEKLIISSKEKIRVKNHRNLIMMKTKISQRKNKKMQEKYTNTTNQVF